MFQGFMKYVIRYTNYFHFKILKAVKKKKHDYLSFEIPLTDYN